MKYVTEKKNVKTERFALFSILTFLISSLLAIAISEVTIRVLVPEETFWPISNIYHKSTNDDVVYTNRPNFRGTAFGVSLETNELGFRGENWSKQKSPEVFRIVLIGDSHAFGFGVEFKDTVGEALERILNSKNNASVEVLNFGVNGYNALQLKAVFNDIALSYQPDLVLLLPTSNDHNPALRVNDDGWLHWDGNPGNDRSRIVDKSISKTKHGDSPGILKNSHLYLYLKLQLKRRAGGNDHEVEKDQIDDSSQSKPGWMASFPSGPVSERLQTTVYEPLHDILTTLDEKNIPVVIASYSSHLDYRQMLRILEQQFDVPHVELLTLFPEAKNFSELVAKFGLDWDSHLNAVAHKRWAEAIAQKIQDNSLLPSQ
ncbi:MAG: hypothetical protein P8I38_07020 [Arenicella sp.]|nr:hypothetical protein [Arenicella sp.]